MFKRFWSFVFLFICGIIIFTGCIARQDSNNKFVTVTLSGWSNLQEKQLLQQVLNEFESLHPQIKVKYDAIADEYMDVLKTRLIGDTAADVFYLDALEAPGLIEPGVLEPLDSYVKPEFDIADFQPSLLAAFQQNGKTYGFPKDFSTLVLFYNKQAFAEAGLSQPPQTWKELREYAKKLTVDRNNNAGIDRYGFGITPELARQYFVIKAFGGQLTNTSEQAVFASPESLQGLQLIVDQYRQDQSSAQPSDAGTTSGGEIFGQGKAAMVIEGPWLIPYLDDTFPELEYATAEVPTIAGRKGTMAYTVAYVMNKKSQHKQEAWQLLAYLTGKEGMKAWTSTGVALPTRKSVTQELGYDRKPLYAPFIAGANYATVWQAGKNLPTILNNFNNQFISAMLGEQTLAVAMQQAQDTANREIELMQ
ncbi:ABC transporter substrate-binding protein [Gloeocapsopsis sp. IPPAS B-1203]|uniref:ABC transporter substrate-binding protein n=1 Tax=Gloeocapsopsis sp. IPPAS B-1203 TaxID=2049454 RepID=UPI000C1A2CE5|nr:ABC transporter substrate-binding protein [Gloeocapsopsis sp. IPPAS B-1203]PIG91178.1 ABC transporter substrate-binding protein [Gloeocapsopsis sp. IPPAS B-1203]